MKDQLISEGPKEAFNGRIIVTITFAAQDRIVKNLKRKAKAIAQVCPRFY
jgi:hypothetical protein